MLKRSGMVAGLLASGRIWMRPLFGSTWLCGRQRPWFSSRPVCATLSDGLGRTRASTRPGRRMRQDFGAGKGCLMPLWFGNPRLLSNAIFSTGWWPGINAGHPTGWRGEGYLIRRLVPFVIRVKRQSITSCYLASSPARCESVSR